MNLVSVALATYNGEKYIHQQIDSILAQSYQNFELIIHDDCSTDKTVEIIKEYTKKDRRIKFKRNYANLGFAKNFESIIAECNGEYIAFCDQDDIWTEDHLEVLYRNIENKDVSCANAMLVDVEGHSLGFTMKEVTGVGSKMANEKIKYKLFHDNFIQGTAMMVRSSFCRKYLPVPPVVKYHDYWLALIASLEDRVIYKEEIILFYRQHENNVTSNIKDSSWRKIYNSLNGFNRKHSAHQVEILECILRLFPDNNEVIEAADFYRFHSKRMLNNFVKEYYRLHEKDIFPTVERRFLWKIFFLNINL